jgi:penicillin-binding protein 1A
MKRILIIILLVLILGPCAVLGYFYYTVSREAKMQIDRGAIDRVIASESPVYYADGMTPIGVFFETTHSKYIPYEEMPKVFVKALIASEDSEFFEHMGFDITAVVRAFIANLKAGRVVQGGSTITQQTAKNIFKREKRSYTSKLKEAMQAFLLERHYSKEEIFEMYANQFFVTGYGKGLWIASQYFFGKDPQDLGLVEAAFIAGSLKGPNRYNPFIKKTRTEQEEARRLAKARKDYVLANMRKLDFIADEEYAGALGEEIPFEEGKVTYRLNVVLDYIRNQLESDYFRAILEEQGVDNIATSGISIYTSIDKDVQHAALMSLRRRLPAMDVALNGYRICGDTDACGQLSDKKGKETEEGLPFLSRITSVNADKDNGHLVVAWEDGGGIIGFDGFKAMGAAWYKARAGSWATFDQKQVPAFLKTFQAGDQVPVQFVPDPEAPSAEDPQPRLVLTAIPEVEGGIVALQRGMITAMVGGYFDRYFNRAVHAKRQLGSIFKPIVYAAALALKWNNLDPLKNRPEVYRFEGTSYVPRPDHKPKSDLVSMTWAGAKSENLATVWLLYHLTDHLTMSEFRQVVNLVGLGREEGESYETYKTRIRDQYGVIVDRDTLMEAAFEKAKNQVETDVIFSGHESVLRDLNRLYFQLGDISPEMMEAGADAVLRFDYQRLRRLDAQMRTRFRRATQILRAHGRPTDPEGQRLLSEDLSHFYRVSGGSMGTRIVYVDNPQRLVPATPIPLTPAWLLENGMRAEDMETEIWVDNLLPAGILDTLEDHMQVNYRRFLTEDRYTLEVLSGIRDFKTLVNLSYVTYLSRKLGVSTPLDPVLSFPLGPNAVSIMEAALAYETLVTGKRSPLSPEESPAMVPIITKIVDREGETIYAFVPEPETVLAQRVSTLTTEILRKVMEVGTGRKARDAVCMFGIPIPTFGKTGTANRFTNSSFVGFIPGHHPETGLLDLDDGYTIAAYAGYDDNRPMKGKHVEIYGASGALPLWIDTATAIVRTPQFQKGIEPADLVFSAPLAVPAAEEGDFCRVPVSALTGLPLPPPHDLSDASQGTAVLTEADPRKGSWELKRRFEPF